jgi:hypothetical protein
MTQDDREYHVRRARAELDMAYRTSSRVAAEAHMKLSMLHMERVREGNARGDVAADRYASGFPLRGHVARLRGL